MFEAGAVMQQDFKASEREEECMKMTFAVEYFTRLKPRIDLCFNVIRRDPKGCSRGCGENYWECNLDQWRMIKCSQLCHNSFSSAGSGRASARVASIHSRTLL